MKVKMLSHVRTSDFESLEKAYPWFGEVLERNFVTILERHLPKWARVGEIPPTFVSWLHQTDIQGRFEVRDWLSHECSTRFQAHQEFLRERFVAAVGDFSQLPIRVRPNFVVEVLQIKIDKKLVEEELRMRKVNNLLQEDLRLDVVDNLMEESLQMELNDNLADPLQGCVDDKLLEEASRREIVNDLLEESLQVDIIDNLLEEAFARLIEQET